MAAPLLSPESVERLQSRITFAVHGSNENMNEWVVIDDDV